jgi:hypothetical protein
MTRVGHSLPAALSGTISRYRPGMDMHFVCGRTDFFFPLFLLKEDLRFAQDKFRKKVQGQRNQCLVTFFACTKKVTKESARCHKRSACAAWPVLAPKPPKGGLARVI